MTLVITGANGEFGRVVVDTAVAAAPGERIIASVRDPAQSRDLLDRGIEVRAGSFDDTDQLRDAFDGADTVVVNATFFAATADLRGQRVASAIRAAADVGARRIVLTTWPDLDNCDIPDVQDYVASEALVRSVGPKWTILRFGAGLADALARDVIWARRDGELVAPAAQATSVPAAARDLAEATARVATGAGHDDKLYELTGPRAIDWSDLASLASEADATPRPYRAVTDAEYRDCLAGLGLPENYVDGLLALYSAFRSGWNSRPDATLARLLGRDPVDPIDAVRERLEPMARMLARR
jgi:NAD(P)H dehydrogenase (quinone)